MSKQAEFWLTQSDGRIRCELCPHGCVLKEGDKGLCRVRGVEHGALQALGYGSVSSVNSDPIEKKPLYHFCPGTQILSIGGWGCNFRCEFCQNWSISQRTLDASESVEPERLVADAARAGSVGIAYTYNEPCVAFEFVRDCSRLAREKGLCNVLVTNGYINPEPASDLLQWVNAANIDVKSMDPSFYREFCGGKLAPVLAFAEQAVHSGCHVEITNLVIPGLNDTDSAFESLAQWVAEKLGPETPLHLSAYYPQYKMDQPATRTELLLHAREICIKHLHYVYLGNTRASEGHNTCCPQCGAVWIARDGYVAEVTGIEGGACRQCGRRADIRGTGGCPD